jgi:hypothetical protein
MGVFGPKYPPQLQPVMNHAERFCELLARLEERQPKLRGSGRRWLIRRREEIELVFALLIGDLAADRISIREAARSAATYLDELHVGARRSLDLSPILPCCAEDEALTACLASKHDAVTLEAVTRIFADGASTPGAAETWFDPSALLDERAELLAPSERGTKPVNSNEPPLLVRGCAGKGEVVKPAKVGWTGPSEE